MGYEYPYTNISNVIRSAAAFSPDNLDDAVKTVWKFLYKKEDNLKDVILAIGNVPSEKLGDALKLINRYEEEDTAGSVARVLGRTGSLKEDYFSSVFDVVKKYKGIGAGYIAHIIDSTLTSQTHKHLDTFLETFGREDVVEVINKYKRKEVVEWVVKIIHDAVLDKGVDDNQKEQHLDTLLETFGREDVVEYERKDKKEAADLL